MNVVIVASHDIELTRDIASKVASFLVVLKNENAQEIEFWGDTNKISIRAPMEGHPSSSVERMAMKLATEVGLESWWVRPLSKDRAANFDRDYRLVESADRVMAFFHEDRVMMGGTGHVVQAALLRGVPVEAWTGDAEGGLISIGSDDGFEVGEEGSRWMQQRYLEWQAQEVENQLWPKGGLIWATTNVTSRPPIATISGVTIGSDGTITGKIVLNTDESASPFSQRFRSLSFIGPRSG